MIFSPRAVLVACVFLLPTVSAQAATIDPATTAAPPPPPPPPPPGTPPPLPAIQTLQIKLWLYETGLFSIAQFDPANGVLTNVDVYGYATASESITIGRDAGFGAPPPPPPPPPPSGGASTAPTVEPTVEPLFSRPDITETQVVEASASLEFAGLFASDYDTIERTCTYTYTDPGGYGPSCYAYYDSAYATASIWGSFSDPDDLAQFIGMGTIDGLITRSGSQSDYIPLGYIQVGYTYDTSISAVPLPAGLPLLLAGLGAFGLLRRKKSA